jgi:hypothetical protein
MGDQAAGAGSTFLSNRKTEALLGDVHPKG